MLPIRFLLNPCLSLRPPSMTPLSSFAASLRPTTTPLPPSTLTPTTVLWPTPSTMFPFCLPIDHSRMPPSASWMLAIMPIILKVSDSSVFLPPIVELPEPPRPSSFGPTTLPRFRASSFPMARFPSSFAPPAILHTVMLTRLVTSVSLITFADARTCLSPFSPLRSAAA